MLYIDKIFTVPHFVLLFIVLWFKFEGFGKIKEINFLLT
jgi:hypothetical protein